VPTPWTTTRTDLARYGLEFGGQALCLHYPGATSRCGDSPLQFSPWSLGNAERAGLFFWNAGKAADSSQLEVERDERFDWLLPTSGLRVWVGGRGQALQLKQTC
jgi:hypothetical protein